MQGIQIFRNMVKCCYSYRSPQSLTCCMTAQVADDDNDDNVDSKVRTTTIKMMMMINNSFRECCGCY